MSLKIASDDCARVLRVLADRTRLRVVRLLLDRPQRVGELADALRIEQSLLSHHLQVMREHGLVLAHREGKAVRYRLAPQLVSRRVRNGIDLGCCALRFSEEYLLRRE